MLINVSTSWRWTVKTASPGLSNVISLSALISNAATTWIEINSSGFSPTSSCKTGIGLILNASITSSEPIKNPAGCTNNLYVSNHLPTGIVLLINIERVWYNLSLVIYFKDSGPIWDAGFFICWPELLILSFSKSIAGPTLKTLFFGYITSGSTPSAA